tara:strand:- start:205 stop:498 length:294 start_codon:yes stop_codon:yes gene_type:complete
MNEQELEKLANLVVDKLIQKQSEMDDEFNENLRSMIDHENNTDSTMNIDVKYTTVGNKADDGFQSFHEKNLAKYIEDEDYINAAKTKKLLDDYNDNR